MSRTFKSAIAAFAIAAMFAPAAMAEVGVEKVYVHVHYDDLDLSNPAAGRVLLNRIKHAAHRVCGNEFSTVWPPQIRSVSDCRRDSIEAAVRNANIEMLTLAWNSKAPPKTYASR